MAPKTSLAALSAALPDFDVYRGLGDPALGDLDGADDLALVPPQAPVVGSEASGGVTPKASAPPPPSSTPAGPPSTLKEAFAVCKLPEALQGPLLALI